MSKKYMLSGSITIVLGYTIILKIIDFLFDSTCKIQINNKVTL